MSATNRRLFLLPWLASACHPLGSLPYEDTGGPSNGAERIALTPARIEFPLVSVNVQGAAEATFTIYNLGGDTITVSGQDEVIGSEIFTVEAGPLLSIEAGARQDLTVRFAPTTEGVYEADIIVEPGGESLHLVGAATAPIARIGDVHIDPVVLGCSGTGTVGIANDGSETLEILSATVAGGEYAVLDAPAEVSPGGSSAAALSFTPAGGGQRGDTLILTTNDPARPTLAVPLSVLGYEGDRIEESFRYTPANPTDILFLIDTAATMTSGLQKSNTAVDAYITQIRDTNLDFHLLALPSGDACPANSHAYATRSDTSAQAQVVMERGIGGPSGVWDDDLLGLALLALQSGESGECLEGFRRPDADLQIIVLSDGPSRGEVDTQVATIASGLSDDAGMRLSVLTPATADCGTVMDDYTTASRTTGGTAADLCAEEWTSAFLDFATLPPGAEAVHYPLAQAPVPSTVEVAVEGAPFDLWSYDAATNAVIFDGDAVPALGAEVTISYVLAVTCVPEGGG